ncbi:OLC1v1015635C1 [Oldenlandia corymbosa var. corymbosa]|uniref:OLC1v1015635C1 n=1 Tax=Oldenlandia corymbosa var. corymbosa TaxID=529605 RepID=A0AAV1E5V6_OLDCO|nr:OLC1v1015635C1 [Oldenlandia corymbosa var. corymbosa]
MALVSKAKGIADTLQLAGHRISPVEFNAIIFRKIGSEFNGIIGALQQRSETPSYQDLLGQLVSYEVLLHAQQPVLQPTAMLVQLTSSPTPPQSSRAGRSQRGGRRNQFSGRGGETCQLCGILNHTAATCRRRFDANFVPRPPAIRSAAYAQAVSLTQHSAGLLPPPSYPESTMSPQAHMAHYKDAKKIEAAAEPCKTAPKGHFVVYVGSNMSRFVIPTSFLKRPSFKELLVKAVEEYGHHKTSKIVLPCEESHFQVLINLLAET